MLKNSRFDQIKENKVAMPLDFQNHQNENPTFTSMDWCSLSKKLFYSSMKHWLTPGKLHMTTAKRIWHAKEDLR